MILRLFWISVLLLCVASFSAFAQDDVRRDIGYQVIQPKLTKAPQLLKFVAVDYPKTARAAGLQGTTTVRVDLDAAGRVTNVEVVKSAGFTELDVAAQTAVRQFKFSPAEVDGKPSPIRFRYQYHFVLDQKFSPQLPDWLFDDAQRSKLQQRDAVTGTVREQGTRVPIAGAAVAVASEGLEVRTDERGRFSITALPPGNYIVEALSPDYLREKIEVTVTSGEQSQITFYLDRLQSSDRLGTVVRGKRRQTSVSRVSLRREQLTTVPGTFGDPIRVIENLPGLARIPLVGGALLVRGATPNDSGVYLDGHRIPILYHFLGGPSVLNPQFLDRIDFYPGNADVRYNRLTAGVIDVATRNTFTKQWHGAIDLNLLNTGLFLNAPITSKISIAGAVRRSYIDAILPFVLKASNEKATTVVPVYYDYQVRLDVDLAGDDQFHVLFFGSDDALKIATNDPEADRQIDLNSKITFHRIHASWRKQVTSKLVSRLSPAVGYSLVNFASGEAEVALTTWVAALRHDLEWKLRPDVRLRFGLDGEMTHARFDAMIPLLPDYRNPAAPIRGGGGGGGPGGGGSGQLTGETQAVDVTQWIGGVGAYVDGIWDVTKKLQLIPGLRADLLVYFGQVRPALDPRLTARYAVLKNTTLTGGLGLYAQSPPPNQVNNVTGNPQLLPNQALHSSVGVEQRFTDSLSLDAKVYYLYRFDLGVPTTQVRRNGDQQTGDLIDPLRFVSHGKATSYGLEVLLKQELTQRLYGWVAYTLSRSMAQSRAEDDLVRAAFDQTHILTLVGSYRFGKGWEAGLRFRLVSGRPETPIYGGFYDADGDFYRAINGPSRSVDRPVFHQLDLRIEKTWMFDWWRLSLYLDVQNVYNAQNAEATVYDYRFDQSGTIRGLPILPTLGIKGSF